LNEGTPLHSTSPIRRVISEECVLLRDWAGSDAPIFFDFGGSQLWWLLATRSAGQAYVAPFSRSEFIEAHRNGLTQKASDFDEFVADLNRLITEYEAHARAQALQANVSHPIRGFQQYLARQSRRQRRL
jgi:hypothetical protein